MLEYYNNREATEAILKRHSDGKVWVHTGDIGMMNERGSLFITDRMKRMIIRYDGFKVFPSIIENVISSHDAVDACKVVSIADKDHVQGKLPKAHIVLKDEYKNNSEIALFEIEKLCSEKLPEYCQPADYKLRDSLPFTPVGKIDYLALEKEDSNIKNRNSDIKIKK